MVLWVASDCLENPHSEGIWGSGDICHSKNPVGKGTIDGDGWAPCRLSWALKLASTGRCTLWLTAGAYKIHVGGSHVILCLQASRRPNIKARW